MTSFLEWGTYNAICDICGFKFKAYQLRERWDGLRVCKEDFEFRHPQDMIKIPKDNQSIPWSRPEPADVFIDVTYVASTIGTQGGSVPEGTFTANNSFICANEGEYAYADSGEADCSVATQ